MHNNYKLSDHVKKKEDLHCANPHFLNPNLQVWSDKVCYLRDEASKPSTFIYQGK